MTQPCSQWHNAAELDIEEVKKAIKHYTLREQLQLKLWDFCDKYVSCLHCVDILPNDNPALNSLSPDENVHVRMPDITVYAQFHWYEPVWYFDPSGGVEPSRKLGQWIGLAEKSEVLLPVGSYTSLALLFQHHLYFFCPKMIYCS